MNPRRERRTTTGFPHTHASHGAGDTRAGLRLKRKVCAPQLRGGMSCMKVSVSAQNLRNIKEAAPCAPLPGSKAARSTSKTSALPVERVSGRERSGT